MIYCCTAQRFVFLIATMILTAQALDNSCRNTTFEEHSTATLPCGHMNATDHVYSVQWFKSNASDHFQGDPDAIVSKFDGEIYPDHGLKLTPECSLIIPNVTKESQGFYRCVVDPKDTTADTSRYDVMLNVCDAVERTTTDENKHTGSDVATLRTVPLTQQTPVQYCVEGKGNAVALALGIGLSLSILLLISMSVLIVRRYKAVRRDIIKLFRTCGRAPVKVYGDDVPAELAVPLSC